MYCTRNISEHIHWIGGNDRRLALFENLFPIPNGVSYNSYLIMDEQTALMDTVDASISRLFFENIDHVLNGRTLDYLIVNHMEPDHCANIDELVRRYPDMKVVGNAKTLQFFNQFYHMDLEGRTVIVKENDTLNLGAHTLRFLMAPMVHWPEVMISYEESEKVLFSADAFGTFGAPGGTVFNDEIDFDRDWLEDALSLIHIWPPETAREFLKNFLKSTQIHIIPVSYTHLSFYKEYGDKITFLTNIK